MTVIGRIDGTPVVTRETALGHASGVIINTGANDARSALAAVDAIGPNYLPVGTYRVASNLTLNSAIELQPGAVIKPDAGVTVTINGVFTAGLYKVFDTSAGGSFKFGSTGVVQAISPCWYGYVADDATDCGVALQAAFNAVDTTYGGRVVLPYGRAYTSTAAEIPHTLAAGSTFELLGIGAHLRTDKPISIIRRYPATQTEMNSMISAKVRMSGIRFVGDSVTANQKGAQIGATYGSVIDQCQFDFFDWGLDLQACLMARVVSCLATSCRTYGFAARLGDWTGSGNSISECNHVLFQSCRNYAAAGMTAAFYIFASGGVHLDRCISEGFNPVNSVLFDAGLSTTVKNFSLKGLHNECTPTGAIVRIKSSGTLVEIDNIWQQTACVFVDDTGSNGGVVDIKNVIFLPSTTNVWKTDSQFGKDWRFTNIHADTHDPTISTAWVGGVVPFGISVSRGAQTELSDRFPTLGGYATLRHASGGVNYDKGTLAPLTEETGAGDGFDVGLWTNASSHKRWRRFIGMGVATAIRTVTANAFPSVLNDHTILVDTTSTGVSVSLPAATNVPSGSEYVVKHVAGANFVIVAINGAGTIDGATSKKWCAIGQGYKFQSDGTNWQVTSASSLGSPLVASGAGGTIPGATTQYLAPGSSIGASATESTRQIVMSRAGTLHNLYVRTTGAQPGDGALVFTVRKNGAATGLLVTVAAGAAAGTVSDTALADYLPYVAGDLISISAANASASASATIGGYSVGLE